MRPLTSSLFALCFASPAFAEPPDVAVDIAPVHALVAKVMGGLGTPDLIVPPGASPHGYALRPSQAGALQNADLVIWIGSELTPWFSKPLSTLAPDATQLELLDVPGTIVHPFRESEDHDDHDDHGDHADHADHKDHEDHDGHEDHADHADHDAHDDHDDHDSHDETDHAEHAEHDHDGIDPHAWLDPENGKIWLVQIADQLAAADPENADTYRKNAAQGVADLDALILEINQEVEQMKDHAFFTFHDAYQYFELRFGLQSAGAISLGDATSPGPARLAALRDHIAEHDVICAFSEPQFDDRLVQTVAGGTGLQIAVLDPMGSTLDQNSELYVNLLRNMAHSFAECGKH